MSVFPKSENGGEWLFSPKVGESITVEITGNIERVTSANPEFNYKNKVKDTGYYDLLPVDGGKKLKINTWKLYFALRNLNPEIGDVLEISHPAIGQFIVAKLN